MILSVCDHPLSYFDLVSNLFLLARGYTVLIKLLYLLFIKLEHLKTWLVLTPEIVSKYKKCFIEKLL